MRSFNAVAWSETISKIQPALFKHFNLSVSTVRVWYLQWKNTVAYRKWCCLHFRQQQQLTYSQLQKLQKRPKIPGKDIRAHAALFDWQVNSGKNRVGTPQQWALHTEDAARMTKYRFCGLPLELLTRWAQTDTKAVQRAFLSTCYIIVAAITICSWSQSAATRFVITHTW